MTKEDFYIIRNSITMRQLVAYYNFKLDSKGFIKCPFHTDKTASMQIFPEYRGFHCKGCGQGGDVVKFTQLYENLSPKESVMMLSKRFGVAISDNSEIPEEVRRKAQQAEWLRQEELVYMVEVKSRLRRLGTLIYGYRQLLDLTADIDILDYVKGELPLLEYQWDYWFGELRK